MGANQGDTQPAAYLNFIQFDQNYNVLDAGWTLVPATANFAKQKVSIPTKNIKEAGYMYVYLSYENQSNNYVYFDDFKVTQTKTNVIQYNEYYPFGLQANSSWTRNGSKNNFLYNEASELNSTSGWYETFFRGYDASLGRFMQVDPLAHVDHSTSPFAYGGNNPVMFNDPNGDKVSYENGVLIGTQEWLNSEGQAAADWARGFASLWAKSFEGNRGGGLGGSSDDHQALKILNSLGLEGHIDPNGGVTIKWFTGVSDTWMGEDGNSYFYKYYEEVALGERGLEAQQDHSDKLHEFASFFFWPQSNRISNLLGEKGLYLDIDYNNQYTRPTNLKTGTSQPGNTFRNKNGDIEIWINPEALLNPKRLYTTLTHELVHAMDIATGKIEKLQSEFPSTWRILGELRAYYIGLEAEQGIGYPGSSQLMIDKLLVQLENHK